MIALVFVTLLRIDQVQERANIVARVHVEPEQVALADDVHLTMRVTGPAPLTVEPIGEWSFPGWRLRRARLAKISASSEWRQEFYLSPERAGDVPLAIPRLRVQVTGRSSPTEIAFEPLMIRVTTELPRVDVDEAHPVTGPERLPFEEARPVWPWIVIGSLGLLAIILWLRRPKALEPVPAPEEWARRELARMASLNGDCRGLADTLAAMIRGYLQRKYQVDAVGRTTREMSAELHQAGLTDRGIEEWQNLLNRCDLAKFARAEFATVEAAEAIRCAQSLLSATLPVRESPSPAKTGKFR